MAMSTAIDASVETLFTPEFSKGIHFTTVGERRDLVLADLNILPQTRSVYTQEGIEELATSIERVAPGGSVTYELINEPTVLMYDDIDSLRRFLDNYNAFHSLAVTLDELKVSTDGDVQIVDAGHRRDKAMEFLCNQNGAPLELSTVPCKVLVNPSFFDALSLQLRENVYERPPLYDEARAIAKHFEQLKLDSPGKMPSQAKCARDLGFKETKVREALKFASLPDVVQLEVVAGNITYGNAVLMGTLGEYLGKKYTVKYAEEYSMSEPVRSLERDIIDGLMAVVNTIKRKLLKGAPAKQKEDIILAHIRTIKGELNYDSLLFQYEDDETPEQRRKQSEITLARKAAQITIDLVGSLAGVPDGVAQLEALRIAIDNEQAKRRPVPVVDESLLDVV